MLLLALISAKRAGKLAAVSVSPGSLLLNEDSSFTTLTPNSVSLPENINSHFWFEILGLRLSNPRLCSEAEAELHLLCPVRGDTGNVRAALGGIAYMHVHNTVCAIVMLPRAMLSLSSVCLAGHAQLMELQVPR